MGKSYVDICKPSTFDDTLLVVLILYLVKVVGFYEEVPGNIN